MARDSRHCRQCCWAVQDRAPPRRPTGHGTRGRPSAGGPVQFGRNCLQAYLSVCCHCPKY
ncbi:hypothetical protein C7H84_15120 [Burkholderia sp. Nafp2/4-1b]|nr:hypothetical protein C7H84_15120 [Burkholderia sp. Nafp2/4-1b]